MEAYYYKIIFEGSRMQYHIKTAIGPGISKEQAFGICQKTYCVDSRSADGIESLRMLDPSDPEDDKTISIVDEILTIRQSDGTGTYYNAGAYYVSHSRCGDPAPVTLIRLDPNGESEKHTDIVYVPGGIASDKAAVIRLFKQVAEEYVGTLPDASKDDFVWSDFVDIPEEFLARYGIRIAPIDATCTITVNPDKSVLG